jgi:hypothetical protein
VTERCLDMGGGAGPQEEVVIWRDPLHPDA